MLPRPSGTVSVRPPVGASNVTIHRPEGVLRGPHVVGGATNLTFDEKHFGAIGGDANPAEPGLRRRGQPVYFEVMGGANNLIIEPVDATDQEGAYADSLPTRHDEVGLALYMLVFGLTTDGTPIACRSCNGRLKWPRIRRRIGPRIGPAHLDQAATFPQARPNLVARPRLTERLNRESGRRLTLITAPAGFGKTTLLGEWVAGRSDERSVAWVSLDEADNDPARFLPTWWPRSGRSKTDRGEGFSPRCVRQDRRQWRRRSALLNELADIPASLAIVLDDYHLIDSDHVPRWCAFCSTITS